MHTTLVTVLGLVGAAFLIWAALRYDLLDRGRELRRPGLTRDPATPGARGARGVVRRLRPGARARTAPGRPRRPTRRAPGRRAVAPPARRGRSAAPSAVTVWSPGRGFSAAVTIRPWVGSWLLMRSPVLSDPPCCAAMSLTIVLAFSVRVSMMLLLRRLLAGPSTFPGLAPRCKPGVSPPGPGGAAYAVRSRGDRSAARRPAGSGRCRASRRPWRRRCPGASARCCRAGGGRRCAGTW